MFVGIGVEYSLTFVFINFDWNFKYIFETKARCIQLYNYKSADSCIFSLSRKHKHAMRVLFLTMKCGYNKHIAEENILSTEDNIEQRLECYVGKKYKLRHIEKSQSHWM